ncbi:NnrU family protein [Sulfitobacter sp. F26169L]|uniref:NnrU family protein n=1 Tax=Sulfitobacter sp. F26169L TaxID=2996015 RepID=UPI002260D3C0|nr:NnrU family protein [Sulfitobacter sp. F26169L]MCX7566160.1 NnrU family protein [Sulfitobacter sp. F26169L]
MSWLQYGGVIALFFLTHSIPVRPKIRARLVAGLGERGFTLAYSLLSLGMLAAVIAAARHAPFVMIWAQAPWMHHVVFAGMLIVCLIVAYSLGRPNPFSFGGADNNSFDPRHPGIVGWLRHPVLAALALWAALHLLPNGDLAHVLLFGIFAGFAVLGRKLIDRRKKREMTPQHWQATLDSARRHRPLAPRTADLPWLLKRTVIAVTVYACLFVFHSAIIRVPLI